VSFLEDSLPGEIIKLRYRMRYLFLFLESEERMVAKLLKSVAGRDDQVCGN
jgi:hypothetical protein